MKKPLNRLNALEKIKALLSTKNIDVSGTEISEETKLSDLIDSLDAVELCMEIEKELDCIIDDAVMEAWVTFGDIVSCYLDYYDKK